jgi:hypothetical protein
LDAGAVATVVRKLSKNIVTLKEAATELGVGVKVLETTMNYAKGNVLNVSLMEAGEFSAKYGDDVQAVTLLKSGQGGKVNVEVISNEGVTQEARQAALAEEFVHLQQLANPVMRAKMLKLTEENLASWPQMSRADRVDLIQTKLEVEADAQKILLKEGGPNVDRAMAQEHLTNIEEKLGELDKATQAGRVPEWVEHAEAPRLFSKEGEEASKSVGTVQGGGVEPSHSGTMQVGTNAPNSTRTFLNNTTNPELRQALLERSQDLRGQLPSKLKREGNFGIAQIDIEGLPTELKAHSKISFSTDKGADGGFVLLKPESEWTFTPKRVTPKGIVSESGYLRHADTEFKLLDDIASRLGPSNPQARGTVNLFTERLTCQSCGDVVLDFRNRYPNVQLNVFTRD